MLRTVTATQPPLFQPPLLSRQRIRRVDRRLLLLVLPQLSSAQRSRRASLVLQSTSGYWLLLAPSHPTAEVVTQAAVAAATSDEGGMAVRGAVLAGDIVGAAAETERGGRQAVG